MLPFVVVAQAEIPHSQFYVETVSGVAVMTNLIPTGSYLISKTREATVLDLKGQGGLVFIPAKMRPDPTRETDSPIHPSNCTLGGTHTIRILWSAPSLEDGSRNREEALWS